MNWSVILGTLGVVSFLKGLLIVLFPKPFQKLTMKMAKKMRYWGTIALILGIVLICLANLFN